MPHAASQFFVIFSVKVSFHKTHNLSMSVKIITWKGSKLFGKLQSIFIKAYNSLWMKMQSWVLMCPLNYKGREHAYWFIPNICLEKSLISVDEFLITGFFCIFSLHGTFFVVCCGVYLEMTKRFDNQCKPLFFQFPFGFCFHVSSTLKKRQGDQQRNYNFICAFSLFLPKEWQSLMNIEEINWMDLLSSILKLIEYSYPFWIQNYWLFSALYTWISALSEIHCWVLKIRNIFIKSNKIGLLLYRTRWGKCLRKTEAASSKW